MITLKSLPYNSQALEPIISEQTLNFHYGKHHQAYVDNLNKLISGTDWENLSLEEIVIKSFQDPTQVAIFNNAGQVYNHDIFWQSLRPATENMQPGEKTLKLIESSFSSLDNFYEELKTAALTQFGSGWAWLIKEGDYLKIVKTANANNPLTSGHKPLLAIDVWEHAYYLDYQNKRADFLEAILRQLLNWEYVENNLVE